jgi:GNAT superfamily N-acetyltransferase
MPICVRPLDRGCDLPAVAALLTLEESEPVTEAILRNRDQRRPDGEIRHAVVAVDGAGRVVGFGETGRRPSAPAGRFNVRCVVELDTRRRGVGAILYDELRRFAQDQAATSLEARVRDNAPEPLGFATRRGFAISRHLFESTLDLGGFDPVPFAGVVDAVARGGIRFFCFADTPGTEKDQRRLWELNVATGRDVPGADPAWHWPFEQFVRDVFGSHWFRPEGQILAADGERWVGLAAHGQTRPGMMYNAHTGVLREYRGRRIALALKLLGIDYARHCQSRYLRTNNDSENAPMLAVNRKLGYRPEPGFYRLVKEPA